MNNNLGADTYLVKIGMVGLVLTEKDIIQMPTKSEGDTSESKYFEFQTSAESYGDTDSLPELFASVLVNIKTGNIELDGIGTLVARSGNRFKYLFNER